MSIADTERVNLYMATEGTWGEDPDLSATFQRMRATAITLAPTKATGASAAMRGDRRSGASVHLGQGAGGGWGFEWAIGEYDGLIGAVLGDAAPVTLNATASDVTITKLTATFSSAATDITAGVLKGMFIRVSGAATAGNNGIWEVVSITAGAGPGPYVITVLDPDGKLTDEAPTAAVTFKTSTYRDGTDKVSYLLETEFADLAGAFINYTGMVPANLALTFGSRAIVTGTVDFMGRCATPQATTAGDGSPTAASTTAPLASGWTPAVIGGVADAGIIEGTDAMTAVQQLTIAITGNTREQIAISTRYPIGVGLGEVGITGTARVYMQDLGYLNDYLAHTPTSLVLNLADAAGHAAVIHLPRVHWEGQTAPEVASRSSDVFLPLTWRAEVDSTYGYQAQLSVFA